MTKGTADEIKFFVPKTLQKVQRIADDCVTLSIKIEDRFTNFIKEFGYFKYLNPSLGTFSFSVKSFSVVSNISWPSKAMM
jgi:hypothetical protein